MYKIFSYSVRDSAWKNSFDDDSGAASANDAKSKSASIVDQIDHFNLRPLRVQLYNRNNVWLWLLTDDYVHDGDGDGIIRFRDMHGRAVWEMGRDR